MSTFQSLHKLTNHFGSKLVVSQCEDPTDFAHGPKVDLLPLEMKPLQIASYVLLKENNCFYLA
jgi:hypothetical protein